MDGFSVSILTTIITIIISFFIAFVVKIMVIVLDKFSKPVQQVETKTAAQDISNDETDIAAVIAIASSQSK